MLIFPGLALFKLRVRCHGTAGSGPVLPRRDGAGSEPEPLAALLDYVTATGKARTQSPGPTVSPVPGKVC